MKKWFFLLAVAALAATTNTKANKENGNSWSSFHGILKPQYDRNALSEDQLTMILEYIVQRDPRMYEYVRKDIPHPYEIIMPQLSYMVIEDDYEKGYITEAEFNEQVDYIKRGIFLPEQDALEAVRRIVWVWETNFFVGGMWLSGMWNSKGVQDFWNPGARTERIGYLDGNRNKPVVSGYCLNVIVPGPNFNQEVEEKLERNIRRTYDEPLSPMPQQPGGINNTNTNTVIVRVPSGGGGGGYARNRPVWTDYVNMGLNTLDLLLRNRRGGQSYYPQQRYRMPIRHPGYRRPPQWRPPVYQPQPRRYQTSTLNPHPARWRR